MRASPKSINADTVHLPAALVEQQVFGVQVAVDDDPGSGARRGHRLVQQPLQLGHDSRHDRFPVDQLGQHLPPPAVQQGVPGFALVDGGQRFPGDGMEPANDAPGLGGHLQQGLPGQLRLQLVEGMPGAELHREVAPIGPVPKHPGRPDGRHRHIPVAGQQLHQSAFEGEFGPERAVDLDHDAPVEDEHRVGVGLGSLDPVIGDASRAQIVSTTGRHSRTSLNEDAHCFQVSIGGSR